MSVTIKFADFLNALTGESSTEFPYLIAKTERTVPHPIHIAALHEFRKIQLPKSFLTLEKSHQLANIQTLIQIHIKKFHRTPFGKILGYYFKTSKDQAFFFSTEGLPIAPVDKTQEEGCASLSLK